MKKILSVVVVLFAVMVHISAQKEITYINPPAVNGDGYSLWVDDIVSNDALCKLRLTVQNTKSDAYLVYYLQKSGFEFEGLGKYYEKKIKDEVVAPNSKEAVVVKVTDNDYRKKTFNFYPEGLYSANTNAASLQLASLPLNVGQTNKFEKDGVQINLSEVSLDKKGVTSVSLEIGLASSANNVLLVIDPSKINVETDKGQGVESDFKNNKTKALLAGDSKKFKFSYTASELVSINWNDALKVLPLVPVNVTSIKVIDQIPAAAEPEKPAPAPEAKPAPEPKAAPTPAPKPVAVEVPKCDPYVGPKNAPVKVTIQTEDGLCFKLDIDNFPVVTSFSGPAMIYRESGRQKMKFTLIDGTVVEETTYISDKYKAVGYKIIKKKDGTYAVRYELWEQVLTDEALAERDQEMKDMKAKNEASSFSNGAGCFGEAITGATPIKLKVYWKGNPVVSHGIRIRQYGNIIASGTTDETGYARLGTNQLKGRDIEVEGCVGRYSWSVKGSYCVLDANNSLTLNLDEVARRIASASGRSVEEIGRSWGF